MATALTGGRKPNPILARTPLPAIRIGIMHRAALHCLFGHSVYQLRFDDGDYIGMTGKLIVTRIEQLFGVWSASTEAHDVYHSHDRPIGERLRLGLGTLRLVERLNAGMTCAAECLHSGLTRDEALVQGRATIQAQGGQLGNRYDARGGQRAARGDVARLRDGAQASPPARSARVYNKPLYILAGLLEAQARREPDKMLARLKWKERDEGAGESAPAAPGLRETSKCGGRSRNAIWNPPPEPDKGGAFAPLLPGR